MISKINLIDDFYEINDFNILFSSAQLNPYIATYQPNNVHFNNRLQAYPCHETNQFKKDDFGYELFRSTFEKKTNLKIKELKTFFRKIYSSELEHIFKYRLPPHVDNSKLEDQTFEFDFAGVIYYNTWSLEDGTYLFSSKDQIEPDVMIGAKPNRCVFYKTDIFHSPGHNKKTDMRLVQPFFLSI